MSLIKKWVKIDCALQRISAPVRDRLITEEEVLSDRHFLFLLELAGRAEDGAEKREWTVSAAAGIIRKYSSSAVRQKQPQILAQILEKLQPLQDEYHKRRREKNKKRREKEIK